MRKPKLLEDYSKLPNDTVSPTAHTVVAATTGSQFLTKGADLVKSFLLFRSCTPKAALWRSYTPHSIGRQWGV